MERLVRGRVLLLGLGPVGVEIAKNLCLAGVGKLTIADSQTVTAGDVCGNFYTTRDDVRQRRRRTDACAAKLRALNPYTSVRCCERSDDEEQPAVDEYDCVVATEASWAELKRLDERCRRAGVPFVWAEAPGLFGGIFTDFGDEFAVDERLGAPLAAFLIESLAPLADGRPLTQLRALDERHGLAVGDRVKLSGLAGPLGEQFDADTALTVVSVDSVRDFVVDLDAAQLPPFTPGSGWVYQQPRRHVFHFASLVEAQDLPGKLLVTDLVRFGHHLLHVLLRSVAHARHLLHSDEPVRHLLSVARSLGLSDADVPLATQLLQCCTGVFAPLTGLIGAVAAQEAIKAVCHKWTPVDQFVFFDFVELLPRCDRPSTSAHNNTNNNNNNDDDDDDDAAMRQPLQVCVGAPAVAALQRLRTFIVGAGAIGCELLKYLALLGAGEGRHGGRVVITDDDTVSRSNLNRQFLFREGDIDQPKAERAAASAVQLNPRLAVVGHKLRLAASSEAFFDAAFFDGIDVCFSALDSLQARQYLDERCLASLRPMFDSGTHGLEGHSQPCVPHQTRSYGHEVDADAAEQVGCLVQNFPYRPAHCVQWAKLVLFDDDFVGFPTAYSQLAEELHCDDDDAQQLCAALRQYYARHQHDASRAQLPDSVAAVLQQCRRDAGSDACGRSDGMTAAACLRHARAVWQRLFNHAPRQLLRQFPVDFVKDGVPFWSPPKRPPTPLIFDAAQPLHCQFVVAYARLWAAVWGYRLPLDADACRAALAELDASTPLPEFVPKDVTVRVSDDHSDSDSDSDSDDSVTTKSEEDMQSVAAALRPFFCAGGVRAHAVAFEKDDASNVDLVHAAACLRAQVYGIPQLERLETKRIAGRILPAVASTTSAVAGLIVAEMVKYAAGGRQLDDYRSTTFNLGAAEFANSCPQPPDVHRVSATLSVSEWERWSWSVPPSTTLRQLVRLIEQKGSDLVLGLLVQGDRILNLNPANAGKPLADLLQRDDDGVAYLQAMFDNPDPLQADVEETFESPPILITFTD